MLSIALLLMVAHDAGTFKEIVCRDEVASLEARLQKRITVKPDFADHILCLRPDPANPEIELAAVAAALKATVTSGSDGLTMQRSEKEIEKIRERWVAGRATWIQKRLDLDQAFRKEHDADLYPSAALQTGIEIQSQIEERFNSGDGDAYAGEGLGVLSPAGKLLHSLIERIGVEKLAAVPVPQGVVYETNPAGGALPLPNSTDLLQEYSATLAGLSNFRVPERMPMPWATYFTGIGSDARPAANLRVSVRPQTAWILVDVEAFDADGKLVGKGFFNASSFFGVISGPGLLADQVMKRSDANVQIPEDLLRQAKATSRDGIPLWIETPSKLEPLNLYASFAMESLASNAPDACVVIDMDDELFEDARESIRDDKINLDAFQAVLARFNPYEQIHGDGFSVWRPADPDASDPIDRKALESFARDTIASRCANARQMGVLEQTSSPLLGDWMIELHHAIPELGRNEQTLPASGVLPLLGAISDSDWDALMTGNTMTAGQMGITDQLSKFFVYTQVNSKDAQKLTDQYCHPSELYRDLSLDATPFRVVQVSEPVYRLITLPNHQLSNSSFQSQFAWEFDVYGKPANPDAPRQSIWNSQLPGMTEFLVDASFVDAKPAMKKSRDQFEAECDETFQFQLGIQRHVKLVVGLPDNLSLSYDLPWPIDNVSDPESYTALPKELRDRTWNLIVSSAVERLAQSPGHN